MITCIVGRQPELSIAELEQQFGADCLSVFSPEAVTLDVDDFAIQNFGGTIKAGHVVAQFRRLGWHEVSKKIVHEYEKKWRDISGKITLGISVYGQDVPPRDVQKAGIILKQRLKKHDTSLRLIPNDATILNTATSHHNKLGLSDNKVELLIIFGRHGVIIAESTGAQNITALAARDQERPKRDAFVGMLPPKLALMMVNLAGTSPAQSPRLLDPFCGTGVVLQEAALLGYDVYGTDLSEKMVDYSEQNMQWLRAKHSLSTSVSIHHGDAVEAQWQTPIDTVVTETYLGQPFSAPPAPEKLTQVRRNCNEIVSKFLRNLAPQINKGTGLCLAVPAWRDERGQITHLPLIHQLETYGYQFQPLQHADNQSLLYYREDQVVARQLLLLTRN